jgi:hypothetical protein
LKRGKVFSHLRGNLDHKCMKIKNKRKKSNYATMGTSSRKIPTKTGKPLRGKGLEKNKITIREDFEGNF